MVHGSWCVVHGFKYWVQDGSGENGSCGGVVQEDLEAGMLLPVDGL